MSLIRVNCLEIEVSDLRAAEKFYSEVLGLNLLNRINDQVSLTSGNQSFTLIENRQLKERGANCSAIRKTHPAIEVKHDHVPALQSRLSSNGVPFYGPVKCDGGLRMYFQDPDGNLLEIIARSERRPGFEKYWSHLQTRKQSACVRKPVLRWYETDGLNEVERLYFEKFGQCARILDIGAGDKTLKSKFLKHGFSGEFRTLDVCREFEHDYYSLGEISGTFDCIFVLEVIEHIPLEDFYDLVDRVERLLNWGGTLVISTPNPRCIYPMWDRDMTHIQQYPLDDLIAFFVSRNFACEAYRVVLTKERPGCIEQARFFLKKVITAKVLGVDYAEGILVLAQKRGEQRVPK